MIIKKKLQLGLSRHDTRELYVESLNDYKLTNQLFLIVDDPEIFKPVH